MSSSAPQTPHAPAGITSAPGPWVLKGTVFTMPLFTPSAKASTSPYPDTVVYSPLERPSHSSPEFSKFVGGMGMLQIIRYTSTPVGPYDELFIAPGYYEWESGPDLKMAVGEESRRKGGKDAEGIETGGRKGRNGRLTRVYVSQKNTCYNGRKNWNVPKHLATFQFITPSPGVTTVKLYPHDIRPSSSPESSPSTLALPFFTATFKTMPYVPPFPFTTAISPLLGLDLACIQPPLPIGTSLDGKTLIPYLPGSENWAVVDSTLSSWWNRLMWVDMRQDLDLSGLHEDLRAEFEERGENFLPGLGRWVIGVLMENCRISIPAGERWGPAAS